jgi:hypothetical protein
MGEYTGESGVVTGLAGEYWSSGDLERTLEMSVKLEGQEIKDSWISGDVMGVMSARTG